MANVVSTILAYEAGELGPRETVDLFADLVKSGLAFRLQGSYGRTANGLIDAGYITASGEVTELADEL